MLLEHLYLSLNHYKCKNLGEKRGKAMNCDINLIILEELHYNSQLVPLQITMLCNILAVVCCSIPAKTGSWAWL